MSISPSRREAFEILLKVEVNLAYTSELLHSQRLEKLIPADRALCTELVMGTLRWQGALDKAVEPFFAKRKLKLDPEVQVALRLGAFQLLHLERVPARAAVNESVELVRRARKQSAAGLVNAVLRRMAEASESLRQSVSSEESHPQWMVERWRSEYGEESVRKILEYDQQPPETALRLSSPEVEQELSGEGVVLEPGKLLTSARRVLSGNVTRTKAFPEHRVAIQDEGSQLVARLVGEGQRILDCCAAPGGKTSLIAAHNPHASVLALELHEHRAEVMRKRVPEANVEIRVADARERVGEFDRVLADVPCSGTGTLARNPEIRWRLKPSELGQLQDLQKSILTSALHQLVPGGRAVYSTCSLEREECEDVVQEVLRAEPGFQILSCADELQKLADSRELAWREIASLVSGNYLRTLPGVHPCDGFFAAIIARK